MCVNPLHQEDYTSGYHPQTDGLVEKSNSTLINMILKVAQSSGRDWDHSPLSVCISCFSARIYKGEPLLSAVAETLTYHQKLSFSSPVLFTLRTHQIIELNLLPVYRVRGCMHVKFRLHSLIRSVTQTNVEAQLVDQPNVDPIFVAVSTAIQSCQI